MFGINPAPEVNQPRLEPQVDVHVPTEDERREGFEDADMTDEEIRYLLMVPPVTSRRCPICDTWSGGSMTNVAQHNLSCFCPKKPTRHRHPAFPQGFWPTRMERAYWDEATRLGSDTSLKTNRGKRRADNPPDDGSSAKKGGGKRHRK